jgi:KDO2-lipid IV(A) lauroyltransferase
MKRPHSTFYRATRANQAVVRGWEYEDERLDGVVREVLLNAATGLVDWNHALANPDDPKGISVTVDDHIFSEGYRSQKDGRGVIYVGAHLGTINMFFLKIAQEKFPVQILSYHHEASNYKSENRIRQRIGLEFTPVSPRSLRQAITRLKSGGFVLTGVDRPDTGGEELLFFGRPAILPLGHARLALRTGARIIICVVQNIGAGQYHVTGSQLIEPEQSGDFERDVKVLAEKILKQLELHIHERPSEWMMFIPVWPEVIPEDQG